MELLPEIIKIFKVFVETLEKRKGYSPKSTKVRFVVAWKGEEYAEKTQFFHLLCDILSVHIHPLDEINKAHSCL